MYIENEKVKYIVDVCISLMKLFSDPETKQRRLVHDLKGTGRVIMLGGMLDLMYNGSLVIGIRDEDFTSAYFDEKVFNEPSDFKMIYRDGSVFISTELASFHNKLYTENPDHYEFLDLPANDTDMENMKFSLSSTEYLGMQIYYALRGKIPPTMYIRLNIDKVFEDYIETIAQELSGATK